MRTAARHPILFIVLVWTLVAVGLWLQQLETPAHAQQQNFPNNAGSFTTLTASGQITSTVSTGTAPFVVASTTNVANLNASSLAGQTFTSPTITTPTLSGVTNGTGLQYFNTTTTCTTAATINTPCTTSSITLPTGYSDTNYRVNCTGLGVTQFPQIQTVTKSNTTFTITLNNLTAAAASYTSFDCMVGHN